MNISTFGWAALVTQCHCPTYLYFKNLQDEVEISVLGIVFEV